MNPRIPALCDRSLSKLLTARAADASDRPFISFPEWGLSWTFGESARDAAHLAAGLREAGLARGDRLGLMLGNRPEFVQTWMASLLAGAVDVAIAQDLVGARLAHQLRTSAISAVVCDPMSAAAVAAVLDAAPSVNLIITVDQPWTPPGPRVRTVTLHELAASAASCDDPLAPQGISSIRYTSGTPGPAKAVAMSQSRLAVTAAHFLFLTAYGLAEQGQRLPAHGLLDEGELALCGVRNASCSRAASASMSRRRPAFLKMARSWAAVSAAARTARASGRVKAATKAG